MKNKSIYGAIFGLLALFAVVFSAQAFKAPDNSGKSESVMQETAALAAPTATSVGGFSPFNYRKDTITNAEIDTFLIGKRDNSTWNTVSTATNFLSLYTYDISILRTSLSGTHNVKIYLDKSNASSGTPTDWFTIDSTSTTTATTAMLRSTDATGIRYRLRIKGTGTQSSAFTIWSMWKKKN